MVVDVVLFEDPAPVVIEIDAHLLPTVDPIVPQYRLATCGGQEGGGVEEREGMKNMLERHSYTDLSPTH